MKLLKSLSTFSFVFVFSFFSPDLVAQSESPRAGTAQSMASQMTSREAKALRLDEKQAKDLGELNLNYTRQLNELRRKPSSDGNREDIEALKRSHSLKVKSLLSSEKYQQYLAMKREEEKAKSDED